MMKFPIRASSLALGPSRPAFPLRPLGAARSSRPPLSALAAMSVDALERGLRLLATNELGIVRVAEAAGRSRLDALAPSGRWGESSRARRIVRCRAGEDPDAPHGALGAPGTSAAAGWFPLARQDGTAEVIESRSGAPVGGGAVALGARPVGVHAYGPRAARADARLVVATAVGDVAVFTAPCEDANGDAAAAFGVPRVVEPWAPAIRWRAVGGATDKKRFDDADVDPADPGGGPCPALVARATRGGALLAMGGRGQGFDLTVHDVETQKVAFKAKPPPPNWLGYRAPPWVSALAFRGGESGGDDQSTGDGRSILVGTGEKRLRLYDTRTDKRAVMDLEAGASVITAVASCGSGARAFCGDARGGATCVDLRAGKPFGRLKGSGGAIRDIVPHPTEPLVAVVGLDRYLRVYDAESRKCLGAAFMKQALTGCAWDARTVEAAYAAEAEEKRREEKAEKAREKARKKKTSKRSAGDPERKKKKRREEEEPSEDAPDETDGGEKRKKKKKKKRKDEEAREGDARSDEEDF